VLELWNKLERWPAGKWFFSRFVGRFAPYSGSIGANVRSLEPGRAVLSVKDRRPIRNHLHSVHAIALANLGELTSGLAVLSALPRAIRGIITALSMEYMKKARGLLIAECKCVVPSANTITEDIAFEVTTEIRDSQNDLVARATVTWRLGPIPERQ